MAMSNYSGGFADGVMIRGLPLTVAHPGKVFWVSNAAAAELTGQKTGSDGNRGTFNDPFATLDYAIGRCTASRGDIIFVKPGHAENIATATAMALDVAGVAVVGLGVGSLRPTFTLITATTAEIAITAANVSLVNLLIRHNLLDIVRSVSVAAAYANLQYLEFRDLSTILNVLTPIKAISTVDDTDNGLSVTNCKWKGLATGNLEFIEINANMDNFVAEDNQVVSAGTASPFFLSAGTKVQTALSIKRNYLQNANTGGDLAWDNGGATNTGIIAHNRIGHADVTGGHVLGAVAGARFFDNLSV